MKKPNCFSATVRPPCSFLAPTSFCSPGSPLLLGRDQIHLILLEMKIMTYSITFLDHKPLHMQVLCTAGTRYWVLVKGFLVPPDTNCTGSSRIPSRQVPQQGNPLMHSKTLALLIIQGERMRCKDKMKWMIYTLYKSETEGACW